MTGWLPLLILPTAVLLLAPEAWPRWLFMWTLAFTIFVGCKWLTWRRTYVPDAPTWRHLGYLIAWPGLDARAFLTDKALSPKLGEWVFASVKLLLGVLILFGMARFIPNDQPYLIGWVGMVGLVMMLHFGLFHLLSLAWRSFGVEAKPLMRWPLMACSLSDFWGKRWNTAFRDLTHRFLFRPLLKRFGGAGSVLIGFLFSGVVHDLVISVPAQGGYGGPTLYFLIQGIGILIERSRYGKRLGLARGWRGWLFTLTLLLAPVTLLFHPPFVIDVVVPFMKSVGAR